MREAIKLIFTEDRYAKLKSGDMGTITDITELPDGKRQLWTSWDSGSRLAVTEGHDQYEIIDY